MPERVYLVPVIGTGAEDDSRRPKYFFGPPAAATRWSAIDGGAFMLVAAETDAAQHAAVITNPDCLHLPFIPNQLLTAVEVLRVRAALTLAGRLTSDVSTLLTWEAALRLVVERLQPGLTGKPIQMNSVQC